MAEETKIDELRENFARLLTDESLERQVAFLETLHATDVALLFAELSKEALVKLFRSLDTEFSSEVLVELSDDKREFVISEISDKEFADVVVEMDTDDAADVISELSDEAAERVLDVLHVDDAKEVKKLLVYEEDTAGGKMQTELVSVLKDATVDETIEKVRELRAEVDNISNVFVVDKNNHFEGTVSLESLILASHETKVIELTSARDITVEVDMDQEEVARMFQKYDLLSVPVIDENNLLVGRITIDDIVDVLEEEIVEDFYRMASLDVNEKISENPFSSFRMRSPWLVVNLFTAFLAASVVKVFESTIESLVILAVLMPVIAGIGGNAATQTFTIVIRSIALGEISVNAKQMLFKEAMVGLLNGLLVGFLAGLVAYFFQGSYMVGVLVFLAMVASLIIAGVSGALIPLVLRFFKQDPALSAGIFVTACTDVGGFFTFLGLAALFMHFNLI